jgi:hypothetical protein
MIGDIQIAERAGEAHVEQGGYHTGRIFVRSRIFLRSRRRGTVQTGGYRTEQEEYQARVQATVERLQ